MTISPALKRLLDSELPASPAQQEPDRMAWKLITCSAAGMTMAAIAAEGGDSPTHGAWRCRSKKTAPVRRTALSTSDRTSIARRLPSRTIEQEKQTTQHIKKPPGAVQLCCFNRPTCRVRGGNGRLKGHVTPRRSREAVNARTSSRQFLSNAPRHGHHTRSSGLRGSTQALQRHDR